MAQGIERPGFVSQPDFHVVDFILETAVEPAASGACDAKGLHNEAHGEAKTRDSGSPQG